MNNVYIKNNGTMSDDELVASSVFLHCLWIHEWVIKYHDSSFIRYERIFPHSIMVILLFFPALCRKHMASCNNMETKNSMKESIPVKSATQLSCKLCDNETAHESNLLQPNNKQFHHQQVHNCHHKKLFPCTSCNYVCHDNGTLIWHTRVHTSEKPHECYYCDKNFRQSYNLMIHERIHTKETPYQCGLCDFVTDFRIKLNKHKCKRLPKAEHPYPMWKPYECKFCNYRCRNPEQLAKHERTHALKNPFKCQYCPFACDQSSALKFHEEKKHGAFHGQLQGILLEKFPEKIHGRIKVEKDQGKFLNEKDQF